MIVIPSEYDENWGKHHSQIDIIDLSNDSGSQKGETGWV